MSGPRTHFPSPRAGEGAERTNVSEAGEGALPSVAKSPLTRLAALADLSPQAGRGEGRGAP
jgi:hypothetical protein